MANLLAFDGAATGSRVLIADDERIIANTLAIILEQEGYQVRAVYSGEAILQSLDTFKPDLLISDVMMPGITGVEAAMQTRRRRPACKVLLFSGQASTVDLLIGSRALGYQFELLPKPIHPSDLLARLREIPGIEPPGPPSWAVEAY